MSEEIVELRRLLRIAYPWLMNMQSAAESFDIDQNTDASKDYYEAIRGVCQQVQAQLESESA